MAMLGWTLACVDRMIERGLRARWNAPGTQSGLESSRTRLWRLRMQLQPVERRSGTDYRSLG
jgi:hypothetical protein